MSGRSGNGDAEKTVVYVTNVGELRELVSRLRTAPVVGIDTEFMRERTYFARLCLVQLASDDVSAIVDPLAIDDLSPLCELLSDPAVTKVLHAGSQDLEIFYRICGLAAAPIFDTQVAATLAGFPQQVGYGALVQEVFGVKLDKGDSYTDWAKRPLTDTQVEYALNDVRYLPEMYRRLTAQLADGGRTEWLSADFERLADPATYEIVPEEQWRRVKRISSLNRRQLAVAREVAAWRENQAINATFPSAGSSVTRASLRSLVVCRRPPRSFATSVVSATRWARARPPGCFLQSQPESPSPTRSCRHSRSVDGSPET